MPAAGAIICVAVRLLHAKTLFLITGSNSGNTRAQPLPPNPPSCNDCDSYYQDSYDRLNSCGTLLGTLGGTERFQVVRFIDSS